MSNLRSLARSRADLTAAELAHVTALVADWSLLADLGLSDLVLYLPTWNGGGFVAAAQARPDTVPTRIPLDVVGTYVPRGRLSEIDRALATGEIVAERGVDGAPGDREAIPVGLPDKPAGSAPIAVIARYPGTSDRSLGSLGQAYTAAADDLAAMIRLGAYPVGPEAGGDGSMRAGDGFLRLDRNRNVTFASPNALSALRAMGLSSSLVGADFPGLLGRLVTRPQTWDPVHTAVAGGQQAGLVEVAAGAATLAIRSIPVTAPSSGAILLVRNVSELRARERALLSQEATIREIHHRVKNNLQTVAALLRLQARRLPDPVGRTALTDAVQRVTTIAFVHETLSQGRGDVVDFDEVLDRLVSIARDTAAAHAEPGRSAVVQRRGRCGSLPAEVATPLAMAVSELLLNAAEHAGATRIQLRAARADQQVTVEVHDDGIGMDPPPDAAAAAGLGLQIVRTLVAEQLGGSVEWLPGPRGTTARITAPVILGGRSL